MIRFFYFFSRPTPPPTAEQQVEAVRVISIVTRG